MAMKKGMPKGGKVHNGERAGSTANEGKAGAFQSDSFGKKGQREIRNDLPEESGDEGNSSSPVSKKMKKNAEGYEPMQRPKSIDELREIAKKFNEKSMAGEASPTGSEGGQDAKHAKSSKNASGYMKAGQGEMNKASQKKPRGAADQEAGADEMEDPLDEDEEDSDQTEEGMTPSGKSRKGNKSLKRFKKLMDSVD